MNFKRFLACGAMIALFSCGPDSLWAEDLAGTDPAAEVAKEAPAEEPSGPSEPTTPTEPVSPKPPERYPVIVAAGDIAGSGRNQKATSELIVGRDYAAVLLLGDNAYNDGTLSEFRTYYDPTWGRFKQITKPTPGNHEYNSGGGGYYQYFGALAGDPSKGYYSFDIGAWHIVALNTNSACGEIGCSVGSAQEQWLRADLAASNKKCTLAYWHHPRFSSGEHGNFTGGEALWKALYEAGAEVVLGGHDHNYERFAKQTPTGAADPVRGIRQFVVGTGGTSFRSFGTIKPNSQARQNTAHGVLSLTLKPDGYDWAFVPVAGKNYRDSGSESCHD